MKLFDLFAKKSSDYEYIQAEEFRGFKSYPMVVHGDKESERNNERMKDADMAGKRITFKEGKSDTYKEQFLVVFINGKKVGAIFDKAQIREMKSGKIESVYAKLEPETVVYKGGSVTRNRVRLLVKYRAQA